MMRETASRTSLAAISRSRSRSNSTEVRAEPSRERDSIRLTPSTPAMAPSTTWMIWVSSTSGAAPS